MLLMKKVLFVLLFLSGCASFQMPQTFTYRQIETEGFVISLWQKIENPQEPYYVYIEGDGHAFNAHGQPTTDPTPKSAFMRRLAVKDKHKNVIYLARPCQYTKGNECAKKYWTTARFAPNVVEAEYQAVKSVTGNSPVVLIGYSGGAQIAGLIAVKKDLNIQKVITIAGNLNHKAWCAYHHLPALSESLNLADYKEKFKTIPQYHYVGEKDGIVPPVLTEEFVGNPSLVYVIKNARHDNINPF